MFSYEIAKNSIESIRDLCILFNRKEDNILKLKFFVEKETSFAFITETCSVKYSFKFNESTLARGLSKPRSEDLDITKSCDILHRPSCSLLVNIK